VPSIIELEDIEMIPVVQLAPYDFGADDRPSPCRPYDEMPEEWYRYWLGSLGDSAVTGLRPVHRGSWNVPTTELTDLTLLGRMLEVIFRKRRETELGMEASSRQQFIQPCPRASDLSPLPRPHILRITVLQWQPCTDITARA
jgi:hypothetical protein